ncbi:MAG TPA: hypothetical protein VML54_15845 [Candidatus Limnocylindrales bacterium]|nr:hypothetical protein [Candidatus Limnocylindrales bacterium]
MARPVNRQVLLAARPTGTPQPGDFKLEAVPVPEAGPGEVLVRNVYMSVDPYMRGRMNDISDHFNRYPEFVAAVAPWLASGRIKYQETIVEGIENAPRAFLGLFRGDNMGKMLVKLGPEKD